MYKKFEMELAGRTLRVDVESCQTGERRSTYALW